MMHFSYFLLLPFVTAVHAQASATEPCAAVSSILAAQKKNPNVRLPAETAYNCLQSVPLVQEDALKLLDGWEALTEWQSDPTYKANPPSGYLFPGVDISERISELRDRVTSGNMTQEADLHYGISDIVTAAHDGHFGFQTDFMGAIQWVRPFAIVSVSTDGQSLPDVYVTNEIRDASSLDYEPSPITMINGMNVSDYLSLNLNLGPSSPQDPDAAYNVVLTDLAAGNSVAKTGQYGVPPGYPGPDTTVTFANGTTQAYPNIAGSIYDWTGVVDGPSFYNKFCNATRKMEKAQQQGGGGGDETTDEKDILGIHKVQEHQDADSPDYQLIAASDDGSFKGYILGGQYNNTAVIVMNQFSEENVTQVTNLFSKFLSVCRNLKVDHAVIDLSWNGGGTIALASNLQKQLFPGYYAYAQRNIRAQPQFEIIGEAVTNFTIAALEASDGNRSETVEVGGTHMWDSTCWIDQTGKHFLDWPAFYNPVPNNGDEYTQMYTWDVSDTTYMTAQGGGGEEYYALPGYGSDPLPPQTFKPENMVILSEGICASSCTTFSHFLKWQGKVKSIAMGGRPQLGPMQHMGGIKGATVAEFPNMIATIQQTLRNPNPPGYLKRANETKLATFYGSADYLQYRAANPAKAAYGVNLANAVLGAELSNANSSYWAGQELVPLQYLYEAADCRMFYTAANVFYRPNQWMNAANQAFGFNGTEPWSGCVPGSTGHPSSLSGDEKLYNGGQPQNVTGFEPVDVGDRDVNVNWFNEKGNEYVPIVKQFLASASGTAAASTAAPTADATAAASAAATSSSDKGNAGVRLNGAGCSVVAVVGFVVGAMMLL